MGDDPGTSGGSSGEDGQGKRIKYVVGANAVTVTVVAERVQYYGPDGKLITESLKDYTRQCVQKKFESLDTFLRRWSDADQKKAIIDELAAQGVMWEALQEEVESKLHQALDPFDLVCHVAFDQPPLTRRERANNVKKRNYFAKYEGVARQVLEALLDKYADAGPLAIEDMKILQLDPFSKLGSTVELVGAFGTKAAYQRAVTELERQIYGS
jgi:type I restriction enzyme R subunit